MARKARQYLHSTYVPRKRQVYGPHKRRAWTDSELFRRWDCAAFPARLLVHTGQCVAQPMPHGGVRWMVHCRACQQLRRQLYLGPLGLRCRECLGMRYLSQFGYRRRHKINEEGEIAWKNKYVDTMDVIVLKCMIQASRLAIEILTLYRDMLAHTQDAKKRRLHALLDKSLAEAQTAFASGQELAKEVLRKAA